MLLSSRPASFPIPFGANAGGSFIRAIPVNSQIGVQDGAASLNDGFVPDNFNPIAGGGVPPFGQDMNGILKQVSAWCQWVQAGSSLLYDPTFAAAIGGYPRGAVLGSALLATVKWVSSSDNNLTNPDDPLTSAGWLRVGVPVGCPIAFLTPNLPADYVPMNANTIGNGTSGASYADGSAIFLYNFVWNGFSNTQCTVQTSSGVPTTRGANAIADFNASKRIVLPNGKGLGVIGADTMGGVASSFLAGVPIEFGNTTTPGSIVGENLHTLSLAQIPTGITSANPSGVGVSVSGSTGTLVTAQGSANVAAGGNAIFTAGSTGTSPVSASGTLGVGTVAVTSNNTGGGSHNTVERNMVVYWGLKL